MSKRKSLSPKLRFEVFKRDKFTCQYCGRAAPDVILHADHIEAVVQGGRDELLNLVTSCVDCNLGKGPRRLADDSAVAKQRNMLADLEERRQQIEMMLQWRKELDGIQDTSVSAITTRFADLTGHNLTANGTAKIRKLIAEHGLSLVIRALDGAISTYGSYDANDKMTGASASAVLQRLPGVARVMRDESDKPYLRRLMYIQGILRKTTGQEDLVVLPLLEHIHLAGETLDDLEREAKQIRYPTHLLRFYDGWLKSVGHPYTSSDKGFTYRRGDR